MKMRHPDIDGEAPAAVTTEEAFEGTIEVSRRFYAHKYQERPNG